MKRTYRGQVFNKGDIVYSHSFGKGEVTRVREGGARLTVYVGGEVLSCHASTLSHVPLPSYAQLVEQGRAQA